jgi:diguanylate cyclase (GGDEF)-like protein
MTWRFFLLIMAGVLYGVLRYWQHVSLKSEWRLLDEKEARVSKIAHTADKLRAKNESLKKSLDHTVALFEITRIIGVSFDEDTVWNRFHEEARKHLDFKECRYVRDGQSTAHLAGSFVVPLSMEGRPAGYVSVSGLEAKDEETFYIMVNQFCMGVRRAILYRRIEEMAITDALTGMFSRRHCMARLNEEMEYAGKFGLRFVLCIIDVDHFKQFNDTYGHLVGDAILRQIAQVIKEHVREIDLVARYGGEEFCVILPHTDKEAGKFVAERMREAVERKAMRFYDEELTLTISIGLVVYSRDICRTPADFIACADKALYRAKHTGRNKVCFYEPGA